MHLGVLCLGRYMLHSCEPLSAGLFLWLELLLNTCFICKNVGDYPPPPPNVPGWVKPSVESRVSPFVGLHHGKGVLGVLVNKAAS